MRLIVRLAIFAVPVWLATSAQAAGTGAELSPWGMFLAADMVVKVIMGGLAAASVVTWTIWLAKSVEFHRARRILVMALPRVLEATSLVDALLRDDGRSPVSVLAHLAADELRHSPDGSAHGAAMERVASALRRSEIALGRGLSRGIALLATIGSTAPFVGLLGTVWGIMNSFIGISRAQTTSLAVVAPGIAEALLATAIGLVAAIPAVVVYNHFSRTIATYSIMLGDASAAVARLASRDLERVVPRSHAA